ncbi:hypothetical protein D8B26_006313 [Coccidioides posadasii str. Silveira]|uniref:Uncharacterized protein n=2 Tax=Coccidioides posadasii TaxID=199306 RepID=E9CSS1_COCPS|nr:hypothetical protein CPC735_029340 [Coccidioides posadasii C735 delta SOWgp]EER27598.1 hypothetical protein CPC735_029340 [Coccidioides posadasii C735 delta SOWgp]EFW22731.1 conserved hypothetical protein [Coccidioides posadasii str. Silveira]QVM11670.1 hypothetical protein D8B26_006313 [Coccidioides posadasii str. Silveira]|eukprot:XP_003069743.1 hypothetical protein CPC735_029340 [Coccidioides posadasii C735 delta SOWgp]
MRKPLAHADVAVMDQNCGASSLVQAQQPAKFSRYRSVRRAAAPGVQRSGSSAPPPLPANPSSNCSIANSQNESIKRSMSRYRHAKPTRIVTSIPPPPPPGPLLQNRQFADIENWIDNTRMSQEASQSQAHSPDQGHGFTATSFYDAPRQALSQPSSPKIGNFSRILGRRSLDRRRENEESSPPMSAGATRPSYSRDMYSSGGEDEADSKRTRGRPENIHVPTSPLQHEQRQDSEIPPVDLQRNTREELLANERAAAVHNRPSSGKKLVKEKGGLLSRIKGIDTNGSSKAQREAREDLKNLISSPKLIDPKDLQSGFPDDTPVSAVNAGERKVLIVCNDSFINLPITPTTKVQDLLYSAANCLSEQIDPKAAILMETFKQLGIERPLRRYEHVREVLNSWDDDTQNHLEVVTAPSEDVSEGLDVRTAPRKPPKDATFHIYHSQRQGKWDKRYITIRSDGQILMAKKPGGESMNICHMSDFDIYCPQKRDYRRIKPPKKLCFVIKSQQKASMFLTSDNFAHYFSMSGSDTGCQWYNAVQQWRSWYLVSVMGEGSSNGKPETHSNANRASQPNTNRYSMESTPYQLGSFKPLVDLDALANEIAARPVTPSDESPPTSKKRSSWMATSMNNHSSTPLASAPPSPKNTSRASAQKRGRSQTTATQRDQSTVGEPFASTGLLGRTYTQRQNAMREREKEQAEQNGPFTAHGLLNNLETSIRPSDRPGQTSGKPPSGENTISSPPGRHRAKSIQQPQRPLVDLTPTYQEPPHHARKGRGVAAQPGTLLVDNATGPELCPGAIVVPSATTWRKPQRSGTMTSQVPAPEQFAPSSRGRQRSNTTRATAHHLGAAALGTSPPPPESPFISTGLLARNKLSHGQGSAQTGRGVATGSRQTNGRPLLDVSEPNRFTEGSLLRNVEHLGAGVDGYGRAPVTDREKREERTVHTGEGY